MAYGDFLYGTGQYGENRSTDEPIDPYVPDLMQYLPRYYDVFREMLELQKTSAQEIGSLLHSIDDVLKQYFIRSATWGLDLWENELGLLADRSKPYEWRREMVIAKLRGAGTTTRQMIIDMAAAFSGGEVDVIEYPAENRFVVKFIGVLGIPPNMAGFIQMIEQIKPAHLAYSLEYTYTVWDDLLPLTWAEAGTKTWHEMKTYGGGS